MLPNSWQRVAIKFINSFLAFLAESMLCYLSVFSDAANGSQLVDENQKLCFLFITISPWREQRRTIHMSLKRHHCVPPNTIGPQCCYGAPILYCLIQKTLQWALLIGPNVWRLLNLMRPRAVGGECDTVNTFNRSLAEAEILHFMNFPFEPKWLLTVNIGYHLRAFSKVKGVGTAERVPLCVSADL